MEWSFETAMAPQQRPMRCNPRLSVRLVHVSAGKRVAGSGVCEEREGYAVRWDDNGTQHGRSYRTLAEAKAEFDRIAPEDTQS